MHKSFQHEQTHEELYTQRPREAAFRSFRRFDCDGFRDKQAHAQAACQITFCLSKCTMICLVLAGQPTEYINSDNTLTSQHLASPSGRDSLARYPS